ncbi:unnamed protein product [Periconia digitata]|uniref:Heterokaryon incompatibility domain-containing protein n=1 Tax=Periconia digitata TaxID=1303443 RepID=A0A9W4U9D1_9PLEO|nr:unnamed protein product [Periconia digitata]
MQAVTDEQQGESFCACLRPDVLDLIGGPCCIGCGRRIDHNSPLKTLSHQSSSIYRYKSLKVSDEIRLVRLLPAKNRDDDVQCVITHTALHRGLCFEALSYAWGSTVLSQTIHTFEGIVRVTQNCSDALRDLRHQDESRLLWIDAICINQESNDEKNHQVPLMSKIYAAASRTLIYIGPDLLATARDTFRHLEEGDGYCHKCEDCRLRRMSNSNLSWHRTTRKHGPETMWNDLTRIVGMPWFSRVWVLQEIANSKKALLVWGTESVDWKVLSTTAIRIYSDTASYRSRFPAWRQFRLPPTLLLADSDPRPFNDLYTLIHFAKNTHASDPRDKVFALLGLLKPTVRHGIVPDYNKSVEEVYFDFVQNFVRVYNHLDILRFHQPEPEEHWLEPEPHSTANSAKGEMIPERKNFEPESRVPSWLPSLDFETEPTTGIYYGIKKESEIEKSSQPVKRDCTSKHHDHHGPAMEVSLLRDATVSEYIEKIKRDEGLLSSQTWSRLMVTLDILRSRPINDIVMLYHAGRIRANDEICHIRGVSGPVILRPVQNGHAGPTFRLVTFCSLFMKMDWYKFGHILSGERFRDIMREYKPEGETAAKVDSPNSSQPELKKDWVTACLV